MAVRSAVRADVPEMLKIYGPYVQNTAYSFEYAVPSEQEFAARFETYTAQCPWLVWEENGAILGYVYAHNAFERAAYAWAAEISAYLLPQARRRGIGTRLYQAAEDILRRQGYRVVYAVITSANSDSLRFHRALGYEKTAEFPDCGWKFGRWYGTVWMEKRLGETTAPDCPPVSWRTL